LIVDDSRFVREYLRQLLERMGLNCQEAADGREALAMLGGEQRFDYMFLDVNMPGVGGIECLRTLREQRLDPPMKVMMVTTEADNSFISTALDCGADEYLMKPFTADSLRDKLRIIGLAALGF